ncbi:MerR family DNA-binding protein [Roseinatronobacter monicus]|uniref:MerR family DNA-binding protein n=1 Tax=Roseinatronobacter monicus TaxID=393481 RepID=UPI003F2B31F7
MINHDHNGGRAAPFPALDAAACGLHCLRTARWPEPREIRLELQKLPTDRVPKGKDWSRLSEGWAARIDARISELQRLKAGLHQLRLRKP